MKEELRVVCSSCSPRRFGVPRDCHLEKFDVQLRAPHTDVVSRRWGSNVGLFPSNGCAKLCVFLGRRRRRKRQTGLNFLISRSGVAGQYAVSNAKRRRVSFQSSEFIGIVATKTHWPCNISFCALVEVPSRNDSNCHVQCFHLEILILRFSKSGSTVNMHRRERSSLYCTMYPP